MEMTTCVSSCISGIIYRDRGAFFTESSLEMEIRCSMSHIWPHLGKLHYLRGGGGGILTKVVANVANHLDMTYVVVHDDECEGKN